MYTRKCRSLLLIKFLWKDTQETDNRAGQIGKKSEGFFVPFYTLSILSHVSVPPSQVNWIQLKWTTTRRCDISNHVSQEGKDYEEQINQEASAQRRETNEEATAPTRPGDSEAPGQRQWAQKKGADVRCHLRVILPSLFWAFTICQALYTH